MLLNSILFLVGLILLTKGADYLIDGSSKVAKYFKISPLIVGLFIVAFGTSLPELAVSSFASYKGNGALCFGNVVGSNIANIALVLGVAALIRVMSISKQILKKEIFLMYGSTILLIALTYDKVISRFDGILLFIYFLFFVWIYYNDIRKAKIKKENLKDFTTLADELEDSEEESEEVDLKKEFIYILIGLVGLAVGSHLMVNSAVYIAKYFNISEKIIGLTVVAIGTSLPELVTSCIAAYKGENEISIGNVIGSNIFNTVLVLGAASSIRPIKLEIHKNTTPIFKFDYPIMIFFYLLLPLMILFGFNLNRKNGFVLFVLYLVYIYFTIKPDIFLKIFF